MLGRFLAYKAMNSVWRSATRRGGAGGASAASPAETAKLAFAIVSYAGIFFGGIASCMAGGVVMLSLGFALVWIIGPAVLFGIALSPDRWFEAKRPLPEGWKETRGRRTTLQMVGVPVVMLLGIGTCFGGQPTLGTVMALGGSCMLFIALVYAPVSWFGYRRTDHQQRETSAPSSSRSTHTLPDEMGEDPFADTRSEQTRRAKEQACRAKDEEEKTRLASPQLPQSPDRKEDEMEEAPFSGTCWQYNGPCVRAHARGCSTFFGNDGACFWDIATPGVRPPKSYTNASEVLSHYRSVMDTRREQTRRAKEQARHANYEEEKTRWANLQRTQSTDGKENDHIHLPEEVPTQLADDTPVPVEEKEPSRPHVVYFIREQIPDGKCKVGITTSLQRRLRALQTGNPNQLEIVHTMEVDGRRIAERIEEAVLNSVRGAGAELQGEWFENAIVPWAWEAAQREYAREP